MIVRKAELSDLKNICYVHKECFPNSFSTHLTRGKKLLLRYYEEYLKTEPELFFVAIHDNQLVGFCMGYKRENNKHESNFIRKNRLLVIFNVALGILRFDKTIYRRVFKKQKKEEFVVVDNCFLDETKHDKGDLLSICVLPTFRTNGIATKLLDNFERALITIGRIYSQLSVETSNETAIKFYKKNNYRCFATSLKSIKMFKELIAK